MYILGLNVATATSLFFLLFVLPLFLSKDPSNLKWPQTSTLLLCLTQDPR